MDKAHLNMHKTLVHGSSEDDNALEQKGCSNSRNTIQKNTVTGQVVMLKVTAVIWTWRTAVSMNIFLCKHMQFHIAQSKQVTSMHFKKHRVDTDGD